MGEREGREREREREWGSERGLDQQRRGPWRDQLDTNCSPERGKL